MSAMRGRHRWARAANTTSASSPDRDTWAPETERQSHYFLARIASQFDAVIHLDETRAVEPLERTAGWEFGEPSDIPLGV